MSIGAGSAQLTDVQGQGIASQPFSTHFVNTLASTVVGNFGANVIVFGMLYIDYAITFSNITLNITTGAATDAGSIGIYDTTGKLLADIGPQVISAVSVPTFPIRQGKITLQPGRYLVGMTCNDAVASGWSFASMLWTGLDYTYTTVTTSSGGQLPSQVVLAKGALHSLTGNFNDNIVPELQFS